MTDKAVKLSTPVRMFNTGRPYTMHGQRIFWAKLEGAGVPPNAVAFFDLDRGIDAYVICNHHAPTDAMILAMYDANGYSLAIRVRELLMDAAKEQNLL